MRFLCIVGTRPEAIKMAPLMLELKRHASVVCVCSGQHIDLAREPLDWFGIPIDEQLDIGPAHKSLSGLTAALLPVIEDSIARHKPDVVIAQGDTTTVFVAALASFYLGVPFAHLEAGLRTGNLQAPFPEEFNRVAVGRLAAWRFCPTPRARDNLVREGIAGDRMFVTGNTGIDALRLTLERLKSGAAPQAGGRVILLTAHRRENHGAPLAAICQAVRDIVAEFADVSFVIPVHPNPAVRQNMHAQLGDTPRVSLVPPLGYRQLVEEMARATLILTDSGGIQDEAPFLGKPVLVMRDVTERPEAVDLGGAKLVGTDAARLVGATRELLTDPAVYARMAGGGSPYGDGYAAQRIATAFGLGDGSAVARQGDKVGTA